MAADTPFGTTVTFGTSTALNALKLMSATINGRTRGDTDTSHLGTTGYKTKQPSDLIDGGTITLVYQYDAAVAIPRAAAAETVTINWGGAGSGNKSSGPAYISDCTEAAEYQDTGLMMQTVTLTISDDWADQGS